MYICLYTSAFCLSSSAAIFVRGHGWIIDHVDCCFGDLRCLKQVFRGGVPLLPISGQSA